MTVSVEEAGEWRAHTTAEFDRIVFPGGHFYLYDHLREVLDAVAGRLTGTPSMR